MFWPNHELIPFTNAPCAIHGWHMLVRNTLKYPIFVNEKALIREWDNSWLGQNRYDGEESGMRCN